MFGFSKDNKHKEVQVVMALLIDNQGIPISFELFEGNTMDQKTLEQAVASLKARYRLDKIVVVADRGLNGKENLEMLLQERHDFVVGFTLKTASQELKEAALDETGWRITQMSDDGEILFKEKTLDHTWCAKVLLSEEERAALPRKRGRKPIYKQLSIDTRLHLTWSASRANKDRTDRERIVQKAKKDLEKPGRIKRGLKRGRNQYVTFDVDTEDMTIDQARIDRQSRFDGMYAIVTNEKERTTSEICEIYGGLWQIEESFRVLKTDLKARPVFVWNEDRITGHFVLCFLALCLMRYMQFLLSGGNSSTERAKTAAIREAFHEPSVLLVGEGPLPKLLPTRINATYLSLAKILGLGPLQTIMSRSAFKRATGLDIEVNLTHISGQK